MHRTILLVFAGAAAVAAALMAAADAQAAVVSAPGAATASVAPQTTTPGGTATFSVSCARLDAAAAMLQGGPLGLPALIPMNAAADEGDFVVTLRLPAGTKPGGHQVRILCSDGTSATVPLRVESAAAAAAAAASRAAAIARPAPVTTVLVAGGLALMVIGAVSGGIALAWLRSGYRSRAG